MGLNEVFKKVSAINEVTELASEKIELSLLSDLKATSDKIDMLLSAADSGAINLAKLATSWNETFAKIESNFSEADKLTLSMFKKHSDIINQIKDLGIQPPAEFNAVMDRANSHKTDMSKIRAKIYDSKNKMKVSI